MIKVSDTPGLADYLTSFGVRVYFKLGEAYIDDSDESAIDGFDSDEYLRQAKIKELAEYRWSVETGGINGIRTDRQSQAMLAGAHQALVSGFVQSVDWKGQDGWQSVTLEELAPIAAAVTQHVQRCFSAEKKVYDEIILVDAEALPAIDVRYMFDQYMTED